MENDSVKPEEEYQSSEQEHEIYQPEGEPEQKPARPPKKPLVLIIGLILLIILFYKLYLYFFASPQNQVPGTSMYTGAEVTTTTTMNKTTQGPATASSGTASIPSITPASTVSPAANMPNTQPAAAVAVTPPPALPAPTPTTTMDSSSIANTQQKPAGESVIQQPAVQPIVEKPTAVAPANQLPAQPIVDKSAAVQTATTQPAANPTVTTATQPVIQPVTQKPAAQTPVSQPAVQNQPTSTTLPSATENAADTMQNNRLDTLEQGMNGNRTSIQNLQNQINSLASSVSNLQSGINNINNTLANIKNMQIQVKPQQVPVKSTIIKHKRINIYKRVPVLNESAYLAQPRIATSGINEPPPPQGAGQVAGGGRQYFVKAMVQGRAWLVSGDGAATVTVSSGDYLPGYGLIEDINPQQGIVTTSAGGIIQFNPADR